MKKLAVFMLAMALAVSTSISAMASDFTPSVQGKNAPDVVITEDENGNEVVANIIDESGDVIEQVYTTEITITPVSKSDEAPEEIKGALDKAYQQINSAASLTELVPEMPEFLGNISDDLIVENLVVRDLFDVTVDEETKALLEAGNSIQLSFKLGVAADEFVVCLHNYSEDLWEVIDNDKVKNNGDGTVTVEFTSLSPIAFAVQNTKGNAPVKAPDSVATSTTTDTEVNDEEVKQNPNTGVGNIAGIAGMALVASVAAFVVAKRK